MKNRTLPILAGLLFLSSAWTEPLSAQSALPQGPSFRLETEIYNADENTPLARHKILFDSGVIYDLEEMGGTIQTIFDPTRERVVLLDTKAQLQAELSTQQLIDATVQLSAAARQNSKAAAFGLDAEVVQTDDHYAVSFGSCKYETTTQKLSRPEFAHAYHELTVWAARLNVLRRVGVPPFGRMALGEKLSAAGLVPLELTLSIDEGSKVQRYRAHHLVIETLSELDRRAIQKVGDNLVNFRKVSLEEFPTES